MWSSSPPRGPTTAEIEADGSLKPLDVDLPIERSSWIAVRILASAHTDPIYVVVRGKPIRVTTQREGVCLDAVDARAGSRSRARRS